MLTKKQKKQIAAYMQEQGWEDCTEDTVQLVFDSLKKDEMPVPAGLAGNIVHEFEKTGIKT